LTLLRSICSNCFERLRRP